MSACGCSLLVLLSSVAAAGAAVGRPCFLAGCGPATAGAAPGARAVFRSASRQSTATHRPSSPLPAPSSPWFAKRRGHRRGRALSPLREEMSDEDKMILEAMQDTPGARLKDLVGGPPKADEDMTDEEKMIRDAMQDTAGSTLKLKGPPLPEPKMPGMGGAPGGSKMRGLGAPRGEMDARVSENNALLTWLGDNDVWVSDLSGWGVPPHSLAVAVDTVDEMEAESAGRGILASREIKEGDELVELPLKLIMTKARAREELGADVIRDDLGEYIAVALLLISERHKDADSFWKPYLDVLPTTEEVNPTFAWPDDELALLEGSPLVQATESMKTKLRKEYQMVKETILEPFADRMPASVYTFEAFEWAFCILFSRAIRLSSLTSGEAIALIPYADLFNHNPMANSYVDAKSKGWFNDKEDFVAIYSDRSYKKMDQIFISYGQKSNTDLLLLYGFALDRNVFNSVNVNVALSADDAMFEAKKQFLWESGQPDKMEFPLYGDRYPNELVQYLRLVCLLPNQMGDSKDLDDVDFTEKITNTNEQEVLSMLEEACRLALSGYPNSEEEDSKIMRDVGMFRLLSKSMRMAIKHRRSEKRILKRTIAAVAKAQQNLLVPLGG